MANTAAICVYGKSGVGKTCDMIYSFPRGLFLAAPGALASAVGVVGYKPAEVQARDLIQAIQILEREAATKKYDSVVVDDFTHLAEQTFSDMELKYTGFELFGVMRRLFLKFRSVARWAGMHVAINAHIRGPHNDAKWGYVRGGPDLAGRMAEALPGAFDLVLRAERGDGMPLWPYRYLNDPNDDTHITKDRTDVCGAYTPLNLAEILRAAPKELGYVVPRAPGLEWQEEVVEKIATFLLKSDPGNLAARGAALQTFADAIWKKHTQKKLIVRWTIRDALAREVIRRNLHREAPLAGLGITLGGAPLPAPVAVAPAAAVMPPALPPAATLPPELPAQGQLEAI